MYSGTDHNVVQLAHADEPLRAVADLSAEKLLFRWCAARKGQCMACNDGAWGTTRKHAAAELTDGLLLRRRCAARAAARTGVLRVPPASACAPSARCALTAAARAVASHC